MDTLVAKYSRASTEKLDGFEAFEEQDELMNPTANLSVKFAMPPVAQVCSCPNHQSTRTANPS